jgi:tetratricopeptide (TPR) repeat protein
MSELHRISAGGGTPQADVIFVHGLGGDPFSTWWRDPDHPNDSWPFWLAKDLPEAAVHCLEYDASASNWLGLSMPLTDRATNVLTRLETRDIGRRPVVFICHSLGGLLLKQMLRHAQDTQVEAWRAIAAETRAIVFLATPHAGSDYATWLHRLGTLALVRASASIDDLRARDDHLRNLNVWYRENATALGIATHCLFEAHPTKIGMIVDPTSADPGITGVVPRSVDADHVSICKPKNRQDLVYQYVLQRVQAYGGKGTPELAPPAINRLPTDLPDFEGREAQIETLTATLRAGGQAAITAIDGMGGVGKSALAIHVAHALASEIAPDGVLYVEAGGVSEWPLSALGAMAEAIASFDPEAPKATSEREVIAGFRAVLDGKRVLLLLDNAKDAGTVAPLFEHRPPGCAILVTSREKIVWPGGASVPLEEMTPGEARKLLRAIMGAARATDVELDEIAGRCGRLPLALRVAGTFLVQYANWRVEDYLKALAGERGRLAKLKLKGLPKLDVAAVLGFSARQLAKEDRPLAERWQMLAVFVESFDLAAAAAVWEVEADGALDGLGELVARSMVRFDPEASRYRLHDLMRDVAAVSLEGQDDAALEARLEAARVKHARHYCAVLAAARELYLRGGEGVLAGLALYDLEERQIIAGQAWAAAMIEEDTTAARLAAAYADAGVYVLMLRLHRREWISWLETQCRACAHLRDRQGEGYALGHLGIAWRHLGEPRRAIEFFGRHIAIAREIGDRQGEGNTLGNLGLAWQDLSEPRRAIEFFGQHIAIAREIGDRRGEGNALGNLGSAWSLLGEPQRATEYHHQALRISREIGDRLAQEQDLLNLGVAWMDLSERRAIEYFEEALKIAREINDRMGEGNALINSALTLEALHERDDAVRRARAALAIYEAVGARHLAKKVRAILTSWGAEDGHS